jgi:hypothetical protein
MEPMRTGTIITVIVMTLSTGLYLIRIWVETTIHYSPKGCPRRDGPL